IDAVIESAATKPTRRYSVGERIEAAKLLRDDVHRARGRGTRRDPFSPPRARNYFGVREICGRACSMAGGGVPKGTARSLLARRPDNKSACDRDVTNLGDGRPPAVRSRPPPLALLVLYGITSDRCAGRVRSRLLPQRQAGFAAALS